MRWRSVKRGLAGAGMDLARGAGERSRPTVSVRPPHLIQVLT
jgi:hypothetical protein